MVRAVEVSAFVIILVFSFSSSILLVDSANANWLWDLPDPTPEITIQTPKNQTYLQNQLSLTVLTTVPFESNITMTYQVDQAGGSLARTNVEGSEYSATLANLSEGWHTVNVWALGENPQGKSGMDTASVTFLVDAVAPVVLVLSPENKTYATFDLPLNFTLSEEAKWSGYSLDEQLPVTISGNTTLTGLSEGVHSLTVYANDTVGRKGSSEALFFSIKQEPEEIVVNEPESFPWLPVAFVSLAVAAVVAVSAVVYLRKRRS